MSSIKKNKRKKSHKTILSEIKNHFSQFGKVKITEETDLRTSYDKTYHMQIRVTKGIDIAYLFIAMQQSNIKRFFVPSYSPRAINMYIHLDKK